ncbi:MAG: hypothetical protein ABWK00_06610 [Desulfurococcaceae archaeon]
MRFLGAALAALALALVLVVPLVAAAQAAPPAKFTVAADLGHGESDKALNYIMGNITFVNWKIINGTITPDVLAGVDILLIGQPTVAFSADEMDAIKSWLYSGNKALWVGGDSDYGSGYQTIQIVNDLMAYLGLKLRLEQGAVYSNYNGTYTYKGTPYPVIAKAYYRMVAFVEPDNRPDLFTYILEENITKPILMHGPDCVIWVDSSGTYHDPVKDITPDLIRLVWFHYAHIGVNYANWAPLVYNPLLYSADNNSFVGYLAQYIADKNVLAVLSGESIYGDYEPAWASSYYGVPLDGPQWVTNFIRWMVTVISSKWIVPPTTVTVTVTSTATVTSTVTATVESTTTATATTTVTSTATAVSVSPTTTTVEVTNWTVTGAIAGVLIIIIAVEGALLARRK